MKLINKPIKDLDYVELYAKEFRKNNSLFKQQKELINSQINSSVSLFRNRFGNGKDLSKKLTTPFARRVHLWCRV